MIFSATEILKQRQKAKNFRLMTENPLGHTKHYLICILRLLKAPSTTGPAHTKAIAYALNFIASL